MVIVQAGSGPKGQTGRSTVSMGGKGKGKEWREVGMRKTWQGQAGERGAIWRGPPQSGSSELGGASVT